MRQTNIALNGRFQVSGVMVMSCQDVQRILAERQAQAAGGSWFGHVSLT